MAPTEPFFLQTRSRLFSICHASAKHSSSSARGANSKQKKPALRLVKRAHQLIYSVPADPCRADFFIFLRRKRSPDSRAIGSALNTKPFNGSTSAHMIDAGKHGYRNDHW